MGHSVRMAEDGFSALKQIGDAVPDILLSDLNMPRMSGFELLSVVRRRFPNVYVIAMTGLNRGGMMPEGIAADGFYQKASGVVALLQVVEDGIVCDRLTVWASRKSTPVWIPEDPRSHSKEVPVFIGCPECLRAFPQEIQINASVEVTQCTHCRAPISFAVVEQFA
jgi:CheY-like chemotaxis protein